MESIQDKVLKQLYTDLFDQPVIENTIRGTYIEALVAELLGPEWSLKSQEWAGWDLEHKDGYKGEVKQSAAVQTWHLRNGPPTKRVRPSFDIRPRKGHYFGYRWVEQPGRQADLYIFCWNGVTDHVAVDQRDPKQWSFYVVPASKLPPNQKTISLSVITKSWPAIGADRLATATALLLRHHI